MLLEQQSVYAFIDGQNLYLGIKNSGWVLDYRKFRNYLRTKYKVQKAYLFIGFIPANVELYNHLTKAGFILVFKPVLEIREGGKTTYKGNVDAELVLHAMIEFPNYHKAILVTGDGDFRCLAQYLAAEGKLHRILTPDEKYSSLLKEYAESIVPISLLKKKLRK